MAADHYSWAPELGLFGKWPEAARLAGLDAVLDACAGKAVCDLGAGDGLIARRLLERGAAMLHGFELDPGRVRLAEGLCSGYPRARFWQADLSDWGAFERAHAADLSAGYDVVLYLGLHHHLPAQTRMATLAGALGRASDWFALRTPERLRKIDKLPRYLDRGGFALVSMSGDDKRTGAGGVSVYRRR